MRPLPQLRPDVNTTTQPLILVIEDDSSIASTIQYVLEEEGYRVVQHASGTAGLAAAAEAKPDAILLDVMLPDTDGWTMLRELKSWPETRDIPVIFLSAATGRLTREERSLAQAVIRKPFDFDDLLKAIQNATG